MKPRVLVTGGTGFVGRALVERLLAEGVPIRVLGRRAVPEWEKDDRIEHLRDDVTRPGALETALDGVETVYHLAAATSGGAAVHDAVTIDASRRLLDAYASAGGGRVVFVGSLGNYDGGSMRDGLVIDETFPLERNPAGRGDYARAKTASEWIASAWLDRKEIALTLVRPGVVYGPGMQSPLAGAAMGFKGVAWIVLGGGSKPMPLVYKTDVADALVEIARAAKTVGKVYNVVHPTQPTQLQYLRLYRVLSGDRRPVVHAPLERLGPLFSAADAASARLGLPDRQLAYKASRVVKRVSYSTDRLLADTLFRYRVGYEEGLRRTLAGGSPA